MSEQCAVRNGGACLFLTTLTYSSCPQTVRHQSGVQADLALADVAVDLVLRCEGGDGVDDDDVHGAAAHERLKDGEPLFAAVRLRQIELFHLHAERGREPRIERVFGVDERRHAAGLLRFGDGVQCQRGLAAAFGAEHLDDAAAREAADAQRHVHGQDTGGDHVHFDVRPFAHQHDRAVAVLGADRVKRLLGHLFAGQSLLAFFLLFSQE